MRRRAVFHRLRVREVERLTKEAVAVTFDVPDDLASEYAFLPGQHVTVRTPAAGDDKRRSYSICSSPDSGLLRIGVKRIHGGGFSTYALEEMRPGDEIDVMTPTGRFCVRPVPGLSRHLVTVAAGSGITPILSIATGVLEREPSSSVTLIYGNRGVGSVMFLDEVHDLKDRFPDRFRLFHVLSREHSEVELLAGRIDAAKFRRFLDTLVPADSVDGWYLCGPYGMVEDVRGVLRERGVPRERLHTELFHVGPLSERPAPDVTGTGEECEVTAILDGRRATFRLTKEAGPAVLDGVLQVRPDTPFACRGGVCGTCRARVVEGRVRMDRCYALETDEVERGYVLTCQAHPTTDRLVVDYDA